MEPEQQKRLDSSSWHSYPEIFNLGHKAITELFNDDVLIEEKVDGSQFSFGLIDGAIKVRSKGREFPVNGSDKMFQLACNTVEKLHALGHLREGWTYRGEYLSKPKHNSLAYDRTPKDNIILFDITTGHEEYLDYASKKAVAERIGLEVVPCLFQGKIDTVEQVRAILDRVSILGGHKIEGVVIKNYKRFTTQKKAMFGKYVTEEFKEIHRREWKNSNPTQGDIVTQLAMDFKTPARWNKAIQHLRESGQITDSPQDIGPLMKEIVADILKECEDEMKQRLFQYAWPHVSRQVTRGFPEYYKQKLLDQQFGVEPNLEKRIDDARERSEKDLT
ncbi:MAG: RNA ligase family protein [Chitinophagaceae bacterium]